MFYKKGALENFAKLTEKHLCPSFLFNKVAGLISATLSKKRVWRRCFLNFSNFFKNMFFTEYLRVTASLDTAELIFCGQKWMLSQGNLVFFFTISLLLFHGSSDVCFNLRQLLFLIYFELFLSVCLQIYFKLYLLPCSHG